MFVETKEDNLFYDSKDSKLLPYKFWKYEECAIQRFFAEERKKPSHLRSKICMLACRCKQCILRQGHL